MAIEIEKKYRLSADDSSAVEEELKFFGAEFFGEELEENTLFGGGILTETGSALRVRKTGTRSLLTFKRRIQSPDSIKQNVEHETEISDAEAISKIIGLLGFQPVLIYEKRRRTWQLNEVEIVLDVLPFGSFMEIEGTGEQIRETEFLLSATGYEVVHETYPMLTTMFGKREGDLFVARFPKS